MPVTDRTTSDPDLDPGPRRFGRRRSTEASTPVGTKVAAAGAGTALLIARIVHAIATIVALLLVLGIVFVVLKASPGNTIVSHVHTWAKFLAGPFDGLFKLKSSKGTLALNWGIAAVVYSVVGHFIARLIAAPHRAYRNRVD